MKWLPWCLALIFLLTIGWTAFVAWVEATQFRHTNVTQLVIAAVNKSAPATPFIFLVSMLIVSGADLLEGVIMVTKRYLDSKFVEPIRKQLREEGREEGREEAIKLWKAWNRRREDAEKRGEFFTEPPPGTESPNGKNVSN